MAVSGIGKALGVVLIVLWAALWGGMLMAAGIAAIALGIPEMPRAVVVAGGVFTASLGAALFIALIVNPLQAWKSGV